MATEQRPAPPNEELGHSSDGSAPQQDQIPRDRSVNLEPPEEEIQDEILQAQAQTLHTLLEDEPNHRASENAGKDEFPALAKLWIEHVKLAQQFIDEISAATLDNGKPDEDVILHLRNPEEGLVNISKPNT